MGETQENSVMDVLRTKRRVEANSGDRINLEDNVAKVVHRGRGIRRNGVNILSHGHSA